MRQPLKPVPGGFADRLVRGEGVIAVPDLLDAAEQPVGPGAQLLTRFGARSYLGVALRQETTRCSEQSSSTAGRCGRS